MSKGGVERAPDTMKTSNGSCPLPRSVPNKTRGAKHNNKHGKIVQRHLPTNSSVVPLKLKDTIELSKITTIPEGVMAIEEPVRRTEKVKGTRGGKRSSLTNDFKVVLHYTRAKKHRIDFAVFFDYMLFMLKLNEQSATSHSMSYLVETLTYWAGNSYTLPEDEIIFRIKSLIFDNIKIMNEMDDQPDDRTDEEIRIDTLEEECFAQRTYDI